MKQRELVQAIAGLTDEQLAEYVGRLAATRPELLGGLTEQEFARFIRRAASAPDEWWSERDTYWHHARVVEPFRRAVARRDLTHHHAPQCRVVATHRGRRSRRITRRARSARSAPARSSDGDEPHLVVLIPLEGEARLELHAATLEDEARLRAALPGCRRAVARLLDQIDEVTA